MPELWDSLTAERGLVEAIVPDIYSPGIRLDVFLARQFPDESRAFFQRAIREGRVFANGLPGEKSTKVFPGNVVEIDWPPPESMELQAENLPLDILFEDDDIIVINKPAGLVVHPAHGNTTGTLVHGLMYHDGEAFEEMMDEQQRPGIVHRLDKDTSGVLIVAKNPAAYSTLKDTFREHALRKIYWALSLGHYDAPSGQIDAPIGRHPTQRVKMAVVPDGKPSSSRYRVLAEAHGVSLVEIDLLTGRTHQIRVHLSHIGHPVLGDRYYGGRPKDFPFLPDRQLLHAKILEIPHPKTGAVLHFEAPPPDDFLAAMASLEIRL